MLMRKFLGNLTGKEQHRIMKFLQSWRYLYDFLPDERGFIVINTIEDSKFFERLTMLCNTIDKNGTRNILKVL